jgi:hypothetical protein
MTVSNKINVVIVLERRFKMREAGLDSTGAGRTRG